MEMKTDSARILMSDTLKGQLPELESDMLEQLQDKYVYVIVERVISSQLDPFSGLLRTVLFDTEPEIEIKVELEEAMKTVKASDLKFRSFDIQHGDANVVTMPGPFRAKAARIQEIDVTNQTCVLALHLIREKKA